MKQLAPIICVCFGVLIANGACAEDVALSLEFFADEIQTSELVEGRLTASITNVSNDLIRNVNLRPDGIANLGFSREVLQFGRLHAGETVAVTQLIHAPISFFEQVEPTNWRLDFDRSDGEHRQLLLVDDPSP